jgi:DNA-binding PadR family transcriptional regulator
MRISDQDTASDASDLPDVSDVTTAGYAILGVLARGSYSGYDIARLMTRPVGFFWQARRNQLYPELARLTALGLATFERVTQDDRPDKKVYALTEAGLRALRRWATEPAQVAPARNEFVLKVYSLWLADPAEALALVRARQRHHAEAQRQFEERAGWLEAHHLAECTDTTSPMFGDYATLQAGIRYERGYWEWCVWLAAHFERAAERASTAPSPAAIAPTATRDARAGGTRRGVRRGT